MGRSSKVGKREQQDAMYRALRCLSQGSKATRVDAEILLDMYEQILDQDHRIGTDGYSGRGYFWNREYKHTMRDITDAGRRRVHNTWLAAGLELDGESDEHHRLMMNSLSKADYKSLDR